MHCEIMDNTKSELQKWALEMKPVIESWAMQSEALFQEWAVQYEALSQEQAIWFWIAVTLAVFAIVAGISYLIYRTIRGLNTLLESPEGWRPVCFKSWMWVGTGMFLLLTAWQMESEAVPAWTVAAAAGALTILGFVWFTFRRLKLIRGIGATIVNTAIGMIIAPLVIYLGLFIIFLIVALIAWWFDRTFNSRRVLIVER